MAGGLGRMFNRFPQPKSWIANFAETAAPDGTDAEIAFDLKEYNPKLNRLQLERFSIILGAAERGSAHTSNWFRIPKAIGA
jgi:hypothetical protein